MCSCHHILIKAIFQMQGLLLELNVQKLLTPREVLFRTLETIFNRRLSVPLLTCIGARG
jgi:hypothetical protein